MSDTMDRAQVERDYGNKKLQVVIHGLISIHLSERARTLTLHVPSVPMHVYRAGTFCDLRALPTGHDYQLGGVQVGNFVPDPLQMQDKFLVLSIQQHQLTLHPRRTHATIHLPWPTLIRSIRPLNCGADPLFNNGVNPRKLGYITFLTYELAPTDQPVLYHQGSAFWFSEALDVSTRLHFFADPLNKLSETEYPVHMRQAYGAFNHQTFERPFTLTPNVEPRMKFDLPGMSEIPQAEAVDLADRPKPGFSVHIDGSGNCLPPVLLD